MADFTDSIKVQKQFLTPHCVEAIVMNSIKLSFKKVKPIERSLFAIFSSVEELIQEKYNDYIITKSTYLSRWVGKHNTKKVDHTKADFVVLKVEQKNYDPTKYNIFVVLAIEVTEEIGSNIELEIIKDYQREFFMLNVGTEIKNKKWELKNIIDKNLALNGIHFDYNITTGGKKGTQGTSCEAYRKIYKPVKETLKDIYSNNKCAYDFKYRILLEVNLEDFIKTNIYSEDELSCKIIKITKDLYKLLTIDFLIIDYLGNPVLGIEYHGTGHTTNKHNDNIKRTALERAGVEFMIFDNDTYRQNHVISSLETCIKRYERYKKVKHKNTLLESVIILDTGK